MRFAVTGLDMTIGVFQNFLMAGWEPMKLFTFPVKDALYSNEQILELGTSLKIPIQISRMTEEDMRLLGNQGCEVLICAAYPWRIGAWDRHIRFGINFHPSPLPIGRGPRPQIRAILDSYRSWGVSAHKLSPMLDEGDILSQETFDLSLDETHESINLKCVMAFDRLSSRIARNFQFHWDNAVPQGKGEYWKRWTKDEQTVDFSNSIDEVLRQSRAFGLNGLFVKLDKEEVRATKVVGWKETHSYVPGSVLLENSGKYVIAVSDGFLGLIDWIKS